MVKMLPFLKEYFETWPIGYPIAILIWHTFWDHILYRSIINFLFKKPLTNRQKRELKKVAFWKRKRMKFMRRLMSQLPQQFSPNIEKYYKLDIFSLIFGTISILMVVLFYFLTLEHSQLFIIIVCGIHFLFTFGTWLWYFAHHSFRDKKGNFDGVFYGELTFK